MTSRTLEIKMLLTTLSNGHPASLATLRALAHLTMLRLKPRLSTIQEGEAQAAKADNIIIMFAFHLFLGIEYWGRWIRQIQWSVL
jgi:hypothetical protein